MAALKGKTTPRLWTPPLRTLNRRTSDGYQLAEFAERSGSRSTRGKVARHTLARAGPRRRACGSGSPRQSAGGNAERATFAAVLCLYFLYIRGAELVLSAAQDLGRARDHMRLCVDMIHASPWLGSRPRPRLQR